MKITLYVDVVSPFAYIAYYVLRHDPVFERCEITYIPIFLGGIMKMTGNTAPINIKNKDKWIAEERLRWARYFGVPIAAEAPPGFPPLTLGAMRAVCALGADGGGGPRPQHSPAAQEAIAAALDALYEAYWVRGRDVADAAVRADVLGAAGVLAAAAASSSGGEGEGKRILLENTDRAFAEGAFGLPWMVCENDKGEKEGFWGCDHLGCVLDFLGIERPRAGSWRAML